MSRKSAFSLKGQQVELSTCTHAVFTVSSSLLNKTPRSCESKFWLSLSLTASFLEGPCGSCFDRNSWCHISCKHGSLTHISRWDVWSPRVKPEFTPSLHSVNNQTQRRGQEVQEVKGPAGHRVRTNCGKTWPQAAHPQGGCWGLRRSSTPPSPSHLQKQFCNFLNTVRLSGVGGPLFLVIGKTALFKACICPCFEVYLPLNRAMIHHLNIVCSYDP